MQTFYAHIREDGTKQTVAEHLRGTAKKAAICLKSCHLANAAYLSGLVHDIGKYSEAFQDYIKTQNPALRGTVIHTFQGCQYFLNLFQASDDVYERFSAEILAYAVGAHHGLFDCVNQKRNIGLQYRKEKDNIEYSSVVTSFSQEIAEVTEIPQRFSAAVSEIRAATEQLDSLFSDSAEEFSFEVGLLTRLILSALIEGDRQDTTEFKQKRCFPVWPEDMRPIWHSCLESVEKKILQFPTDKPIGKARRTISDICKVSAERPAGIYRLNVPTGGGKTLSSLRYALAHAEKYNKRRIIFTSPLLSILEQNAVEIRKAVKNNALILEHHSNLVQEGLTRDELDERELSMQTWDVPIILTTMVQLLNTLFDGKTSSIRRFHSLCDSIIVIDEVQTVPPKLLTMFNLAIQFLQTICGATIVLCSATQPCFGETDHPLRKNPQEIVPYDAKLWKVFTRTVIRPLPSAPFDAIPALVMELMHDTKSMLVVCNTKAEAAKLFSQVTDTDWNIFHLSAAMCVQHRRETIDKLKQSLENHPKTLCIATQVIEAGVNISFQRVLRLAAGMDSVIQAAGRCNRNGDCDEPQSVYLVEVSDEKLGKLPEILHGKQSTLALLNDYTSNPQRFENALSSYKAIQYYYQHFYRGMDKGAQDYPIEELKTTLFDLLSTNTKYADVDIKHIENYQLWQAFDTAGKLFEVFDGSTTDVIVPYGRGKELIEELCTAQAKKDASYRQSLLKKARSHSISIHEEQKEKLLQKNGLYPICENYALALSEEYYDATIGLSLNSSPQEFLEV